MPFEPTHDNAIRCPGTRPNGTPCRAPLFFRGARFFFEARVVAPKAPPSSPDAGTHACRRCGSTIELRPAPAPAAASVAMPA